MLDGFRPEGRGREFLPQNGSAAKEEDLPDAHHAPGRVVQRQGVVDDVAVLHRRHEERGAHEELKAAWNGGHLGFHYELTQLRGKRLIIIITANIKRERESI